MSDTGGPQLADLIYLYDRRYWPGIQQAWQVGDAAWCPPELDPVEWRACAKRLAGHLECRVRTGLVKRDGVNRVRALANDGYPLGLTDAAERMRWMHQRAEADV